MRQILEGVWNCSVSVFAAPLQLCIAKYPQLHELRSRKKIELEANPIFFLDHLKKYSGFWSFILSYRVEE